MLADDLDVLLVEADPLEAELLLRSLRDLTPAERIGVARDGEEALDYLLGRNAFRHRLGAPLPPLVLLAIRLPRLDGIEVLRTLRASPRTATVPIVMLSSATESARAGPVLPGRGQQLHREADRVSRARRDAAGARPVLAPAEPAGAERSGRAG